ncbi:MAG: glycosyltransferase family 4 protein [Acidobacteria bacterium]|nr:glycosyltransferase family 4 protein [Acidobacteriota bacterium]
MRILFWSEQFWPQLGGVQMIAYHLLRELSRRGHEVRVISRRDHPGLPRRQTAFGIPVLRLDHHERVAEGDLNSIACAAGQLHGEVQDFRPDLFHIFSIGSNLLFRERVPALKSLPLVMTFHGELRSEFPPGSLLHGAVDAARGVSTCSRAVLSSLTSRFPQHAPKLRSIQNGIPIPGAPPDSPHASSTLLFVGRLAPEKGADLAIAAMPVLAAADPDLRLVLAGDGSERDRLQGQARRIGVGDRVRFLGWQPPARIQELLSSAAMLLMPSRTEGLGIAAIEAAARCRPVIASRAGGIPEVVLDGVTGLLVEPENPRALANAVMGLLDDPALAARMGQAAFDHVRHRFSIQRCADAYEHFYRAAL